jgi:hypothetical protein
MIGPMFSTLPSGGFDLVIDLNTLSDLRDVVRRSVVLQMRRTLAADGAALFFFQNPDDFGARAGRIVGLGKSVAAQRRPSIKAFRAMLEAAGFSIESERSAGVRMHNVIASRLSHRAAHAIGKFRMPKSLGGWSIFVCGKGSQALDIASAAPSVEIASPAGTANVVSPPEPPKIADPAPTPVEQPRETVNS